MADDEIVTLDNGDQVRVTPDGERYLIQGPDPELVDAEATRGDKEQQQAEIRRAQLDAVAQKRDLLDADPAVPPEKRIY